MRYKYDKKNSIGSPTKAMFSEFPCVDTSIKISNLAPVKTNNHQIILGTGTFSDVYLAKDIESADKLVEKLTKQGKTIYRY